MPDRLGIKDRKRAVVLHIEGTQAAIEHIRLQASNTK